MTWDFVWKEIRTLVATLPTEVDFVELERVAEAVFLGGWSLHGFLAALVAAADRVFPDPTTRPIAVFLLGLWLRVASIPAILAPGSPALEEEE